MFDKPRHTKLFYDAATAISQGRRDRQEDAIVSDFPAGGPMGFAVLSDGMGGHDAGDVASKIVVTEVFSELKLRTDDGPELAKGLTAILHNAALGANQCIAHMSGQTGGKSGMGATLLAPVFMDNHLSWISIGDSPLYLVRDGKIERLNAEHALGSQIDFLVENGLMGRQEALNHPDQTCLTSVLMGREIPQIDCPDMPKPLLPGDILLASSDGLLVLDEQAILGIVRPLRGQPAATIASALMRAVEAMDDPNQDNVALCVIRVSDRGAQVVPALVPSVHGMRRNAQSGVTVVAAVSRRTRDDDLARDKG